MRSKQRYRGESLRRIPQFLDAHPEVFAAVNASDARKQLDAANGQLRSVVDVQGARLREVRGEKQRQVALERDLRERYMAPVATFALGRLAGVENFAALTPSATRFRGARLVQAARAMATAAIPYADAFAAAGFPAEFLDQLTAAADAVQSSIESRARASAERVKATAAVEETLKAGRCAALMLEGAISRLVPRRSSLYAEWRSVKRVFNPGSRKQRVQQAPGSSQVQAPAPTAAADANAERVG